MSIVLLRNRLDPSIPSGGTLIPVGAGGVDLSTKLATVSQEINLSSPVGSVSYTGKVPALSMPHWLTDASNHKPPNGGTYDYNTFKPSSGSFPALAASYAEPIFGGSNIRRLTNSFSNNTSGEFFYGHKGANADGTYFFWKDGSDLLGAYNTSNGTLVRNSLPTSGSSAHKGDISWHPTDPNAYFYFNGADIRKYSISGGTSQLIGGSHAGHTLPAASENLGGSLDFVDNTGQYAVVQYSSGGHVYDMVNDIIYTGASIGVPGNGYLTITPDAKYAILVNGTFLAFPLNHTTHVVGASFPFWIDGGDHAGICSASDGNNYIVRQNDSNGKTYVGQIIDQTGQTEAQILAQATLLFDPTSDQQMHMSGVGLGTYKDWCWCATEMNQGTDTFDATIYQGGTWHAFLQEIIAVNVLTHEVRRYAHHRSRQITNTNYEYQPRVSCSWDGSFALWCSNYNYDNGGGGSGYNDLYGIQNPLV